MKKTLILTLVLAVFLAACTGGAQSASETGADTQSDPNAREIPLSTKLAIGTLKLEETGYAVGPDQAAELLPLWQVLYNLNSSDNAAPEEISAITEQIQSSMTAEQLQAIENMELTGQDMFSAMQDLGLAPETEGENQGERFGGGQGLGGGPPGGGPGGGFGDGEVSPEQIATAQALREENGGAAFGSRWLSPLVEAVIEMLEAKLE